MARSGPAIGVRRESPDGALIRGMFATCRKAAPEARAVSTSPGQNLPTAAVWGYREATFGHILSLFGHLRPVFGRLQSVLGRVRPVLHRYSATYRYVPLRFATFRYVRPVDNQMLAEVEVESLEGFRSAVDAVKDAAEHFCHLASPLLGTEHVARPTTC